MPFRRRPGDFSEEIRSHIDHEAARLRREGLSEAEAQYAARRAFGNVTAAEERYYERHRWMWWDEITGDLRFAVRTLRQNAGFAIAAVLTLALGIGANTAIFSLVDRVLLRPLPYPGANQIVSLYGADDQHGGVPLSPATFLDFRSQSTSYSSISAYREMPFNLSANDLPQRVNGAIVTPDFFDVLGVHPVLGRPLTSALDPPGGPATIIIGYSLWQRLFAGDPGVLGRTMQIDGVSRTIVGIMPRSFQFPPKCEAWKPARYRVPEHPLRQDVDVSGDRTAHYFSIFGRLKSGVSLAAARLEGNTIAARLKQQYGDDEEMSRMEMLPLQEDLIGDNRPALLLLLSAVGLLLIIACVNVANILLARGATRQREIAIRGALGAGGARLMRQLLTESLTLGLLGGGVGILLAYATLRPLSALLSEQAIPGLEPKLDARVLVFTAVVTVLSAVLFGLLPALQAARLDLNRVLKEGGRGSGGLRARRAQNVLVITEVALAGVLLVGAGLLLRSFSRLIEVPTGFQAERVVSMALTLPNVRYRDAASRARFAAELLERLRALPGVTSAGLISRLPLDPGNSTRSIEIKGGPPRPDGERAPDYLVISPDYFRAMGIPLLRGRFFTDHDGPNAAPAVIINETLARRAFSSQNPTDQMVRVGGCGGPNDWCQVVGVVGDVHQHGLDEKPRLALYVPYARDPWAFMVFVVRTSTETAALTPLLQDAVRAIDKDQPVYHVRTMSEVVSASLAPRRVRMLLIGLFAVLALILSCVGIYGVMAYSVAQRTQEIGIRMTLGAARADIVRLVAFNALKLTAVGVVAGSVLGWALTRFLSKMLYGVQPTDVVTFVGAWTILIITALVACYVPALRATRVDPLISLRSE